MPSEKEKPSLNTESSPHTADCAAGFRLLPIFERFNQKDDVFRRSWWDERIRSRKSELFYETYREPLKTWRKVDGFTQKDTLPTADTAPAKAMKRIYVPLATILSPREADRLRKYGINPDQSVPLMLDSVY